MDVVFGSSPLAAAVARRLARDGATTLAGPTELLGPWLWRRCDPGSAEGVNHALKGVDRVVVVLDDAASAAGLFTVLRPGTASRGVAVLPPGGWRPDGLDRFTHWGSLRVGATWGEDELLVAAWARRVAAGRALWVPDLGEVRVTAAVDAANAVAALLHEPGGVWSVVGDEAARLSELAAQIGLALDKPVRQRRATVGLAAWSAGVSVGAIRRLAVAADPHRHTPGWTPVAVVGRAGWFAPPERPRGRG